MNPFVVSPAAMRDLERIWDYTRGRWSVDRAEAYLRDIQRAIARVVDNPLLGRACDEVREGYRRHGVGSHTLYYRVVGDGLINVVRVLHQRMDVDRHLD